MSSNQHKYIVPHIENWKGTHYFVVRNKKGQIVTKRRQKGSDLTFDEARELYRRNKTFKENVKRQRTKLSNVTEIVTTTQSSIQNRKKPPIKAPSGNNIQYVVQGRYKGQNISARSQNIKAGYALYKTEELAKEKAWENFLKLLAEREGLAYEADEGLKLIDKVTNIREGWVKYV